MGSSGWLMSCGAIWLREGKVMVRRLERRLEALEQQTGPAVVGIWKTRDGDVVTVCRPGQQRETLTVAAFREQYPGATLIKIVHSDEAAA